MTTPVDKRRGTPPDAARPRNDSVSVEGTRRRRAPSPPVPDLTEVAHSDQPVSMAIELAGQLLQRPLEAAERTAIVRLCTSYRRTHTGPEMKAALSTLVMQPLRARLGDVPGAPLPAYLQALSVALASVRYDLSLPDTSMKLVDRWLSRRALPVLERATRLIATDPKLRTKLDTGLARLSLYDPPRHPYAQPRTRHEWCARWPPPLYEPLPVPALDQALLVLAAAHMLLGAAAEERFASDLWQVMGERDLPARSRRQSPSDEAAREAALTRWFQPLHLSSGAVTHPFAIARELLKRIDQVDALALPIDPDLRWSLSETLDTARADHVKVIRMGVEALESVTERVPGLPSMRDHLRRELRRLSPRNRT